MSLPSVVFVDNSGFPVLRSSLESWKQDVSQHLRGIVSLIEEAHDDAPTGPEESACPACLSAACGLLEDVADFLEENVIVSSADQQRFVELSVENSKLVAALASLESRLERRTRTIPRKVREVVVRRDRSCCRYCGKEVAGLDLHLDHYYPDGPSSESNLVVACRDCNIRKGHIDPRHLKRKRGMVLQGGRP